MKKQIKIQITILLLLTILFCSIPSTSLANTPINTSIQQVHYTIYDMDGNIKSTGILPMSETENSNRLSYPARTLENGDSMVLEKSENVGFSVSSGQTVHMSFGLNRNATVLSEIYDLTHNTILSEKNGLTGGRSMSTPITRKARVCGFITNYSSDPLTVTWAKFEFN